MVSRPDAGYTLLILMVLISVLTVAMLVALPLLETQSWREKEEELLFRGRQYVEAVRLFTRDHAGAYPESVEDLVKGRYLRKAFPEPMTRAGTWNLVLLPADPGAAARPGPASAPPGRRGRRRPAGGDEDIKEPGMTAAGTQSLPRVLVVPEKLVSSVDNPRIIGVVSPSLRKSFFVYDKNETYNTWLFYYGRQPGDKPEIILFGDPTR